MHSAEPHREGILSKHRLEGLSDGVFSVVLTLLVLELKPEHLVPHASNDEIWAALGELRRPLIGYAITFALAGMFWILQHRKFSLLTHSTTRHAWFTLLFLFWVSLLPFSVSFWVRTMDRLPGLIIYYGNMTLIAAALLIGWLDAQHSGLAAEAPAAARRPLTFRISAMALGCGLAAVVSCYAPQYSSFALLAVVVASRLWLRKLAKHA